METIPDEAELDAAHALARVRRSMFGRGPGGLTVSRYSLQERLGSGGEGAVYAAFDPELGRRVAIKLLPGGVADYEEHGRLVREARLLASISHPNVITIYDAGEYDLDDRGLGWGVFIVLELLEGTTLDCWLAAESRSPRTIIELFGEVGRGLQAVHDTGLVHRDIKPRNILVADDGRVQLADFGIAYRTADTQTESPGRESGTPRFMAPEQKDGAAPDPRADQWSFCAALWTALYGRPPKEGESAPRLAGVPREVRRALERGLSPDPDDRFASMADLVDRIDGSRMMRRVLALGVGGGASVAFTVAWAWSQPPACDDFDRVLAEAYDVSDGDRIEAALAELDGVGPEGAARARARLDSYTQEWLEARNAACHETRARDEDTRSLGTRRVACLDHALRSFRSIAELLSRPDPTVAASLDQVLHRYQPISTCLGDPLRVPILRGEARPEISAELVRVSLLTAAGHLDQAQAVLDGIDPETLGPGLSARWYGSSATLQSRRGNKHAAEGDYAEAIHRAQRAGDEDLAVRVQIDLLHLIGLESSRSVEALRLAKDAAARAELANAGPNTRASLALTLGNIASEHGTPEEAKAQFRQVETLCADEGCGPGSMRLVTAAHLGLGNVLLNSGRYAEASEMFRAHHEATRGADGFLGRQGWMSAYNLALVELDLGHFESARRWVDAAQQVVDEPNWRLDYARARIAYQEDEPDAVQAALDRATDQLLQSAPRSTWILALQGARAGVVSLRGDHAQASRELASIYEQTKRELGPHHERTIDLLEELSHAEHAAGAYAACLEHCGRVLEQRTARLRPDHPKIALAEHGVGRCQLGLGQPDLALPHLRRAHRSWDEGVGSQSPKLIEIGIDLAAALASTRDVEAARSVLAEAFARLPDTEAPRRAEARLLFAMAQVDAHDQAADLATRAREIYADLGDRYASEVATIDRFLADHDSP